MPEFYVVKANGNPFDERCFVKTAEYFEEQGGLTKTWGKRWQKLTASDIEHARKKGVALFNYLQHRKSIDEHNKPIRLNLVATIAAIKNLELCSWKSGIFTERRWTATEDGAGVQQDAINQERIARRNLLIKLKSLLKSHFDYDNRTLEQYTKDTRGDL